MRWIAMGVLFVGSAAQAGEPASCASVSVAEQVFADAHAEVDRLVGVAFGDDFKRRIAYVDGAERDALIQERDDARKQLPPARRAARDGRRAMKDAKRDVRVSGVVCAPPEIARVD